MRCCNGHRKRVAWPLHVHTSLRTHSPGHARCPSLPHRYRADAAAELQLPRGGLPRPRARRVPAVMMHGRDGTVHAARAASASFPQRSLRTRLPMSFALGTSGGGAGGGEGGGRDVVVDVRDSFEAADRRYVQACRSITNEIQQFASLVAATRRQSSQLGTSNDTHALRQALYATRRRIKTRARTRTRASPTCTRAGSSRCERGRRWPSSPPLTFGNWNHSSPVPLARSRSANRWWA